MSVDIEAGGALVTAGLAAQSIDGQSPSGEPGDAKFCANCSAALIGAYCHVCGQTAHVHRSIWHMLEEGLHGVLHFDSKSWRTLPLLIGRPGVLTRRYIDGQRVRYVSPLALFLFTIFLMFFVVSSVTDSQTNLQQATPAQREDARAQLAAQVDEARARVARLEKELAVAAGEDGRAAVAAQLEEARLEQRTVASVLSVFDKATAAAEFTSATPRMTMEEIQAITGWNFGERTSAVMKQWLANPELQLYKLKNTAYKFAFMLIPISLPFLWLMFFWRRDVTVYDHMVFSMYSLSFMSLLFVVLALLTMTEFTARFVGFLLLVPPMHMFAQLRGTYGLSTSSALWRTFALLISAGSVFILFLVLVAMISQGI